MNVISTNIYSCTSLAIDRLCVDPRYTSAILATLCVREQQTVNTAADPCEGELAGDSSGAGLLFASKEDGK